MTLSAVRIGGLYPEASMRDTPSHDSPSQNTHPANPKDEDQREHDLDEALEETFPASDPVSIDTAKTPAPGASKP
ncbi:hypothetical protein PTE30175_00672 [Pandoraea terrae]|uniref:Uncharacterized protein n=1 Tax=Pandoraea terrae TaxID=1537710 RepID=A0A5E4SB50_9BURK|nr:hypothetical protein [Pandoraea terrae]VVD73076.1 hypothetical protein PTE30175_00672 [Pandoraea terrae]